MHHYFDFIVTTTAQPETTLAGVGTTTPPVITTSPATTSQGVSTTTKICPEEDMMEDVTKGTTILEYNGTPLSPEDIDKLTDVDDQYYEKEDPNEPLSLTPDDPVFVTSIELTNKPDVKVTLTVSYTDEDDQPQTVIYTTYNHKMYCA